MKNVLVIGGRSFFGGHIVRALAASGYQVIAQSTTTTDFQNLTDLMPHPSITTVRCSYDDKEGLSALMARVDYLVFSAVPPGKQSIGQTKIRENEFKQFKNILEILTASNIKKTVYVSSCSTIAEVTDGIADENCVAAKPHGWIGLSFKFKQENLVMEYFKKGLNIVTVNPTMLIGDYDTKPSTGEFFKFIDKAPFTFLNNSKINIVDVADAARGVALALEKGRAGERYLLGGLNILQKDLSARIRKCGNKNVPFLDIPYPVAVITSYLTEVLNLLLKQEKPLVPLIGIELQTHGNQHFSLKKAKQELGYVPGDTWSAVDRAYRWYIEHHIL